MTSRKARNRISVGLELMEERIAPSGGSLPPAYYGPPPPPIVHGGGGGGGTSTGLPDSFVH